MKTKKSLNSTLTMLFLSLVVLLSPILGSLISAPEVWADRSSAPRKDFTTGWYSPSANQHETGAGDGNGFERNTANAHANSGGYAESRNNGVPSDQWGEGADPTDRERYYNFGMSIPSNATIYGIEVRVDWWINSTSGDNNLSVELSSNGGANWTAAQVDYQETTSQHTVILGGSDDLWSSAWSPSHFSNNNFRVRLSSTSSDASRDFYLDWVAVRVTYNRPPSTPPMLSSPPDDSYTNDPTPTLSWDPATDLDGDTLNYSVRIDSGAWIPVGTGTSFIAGPLDDRPHTWQVRAHDGRVYSDPSATWDLIVDLDTPTMPAHLWEGSPDQDYYGSNDYDLNIYWGSVPPTGSGINYQLQRTTNGGSSWTPIYNGPNTSVADGIDPAADGTLIEYQVRACTGAGNCDGWRASNGVLIDSGVPGTVAGVGEGVVVGADDDWSQDNVYYVYWNTVADTGSGISYQVQRSVNAGGWATFNPSGQTCDATRCWGDDSVGHSDGDIIAYQVRAVSGANNNGGWSGASDGITIDSSLPDSSVDTGGLYTPINWPGYIQGDSDDSGGSGVDYVDILIYDSDADAYWSGTDWSGTSSSWVRVSDIDPWTYTFPEANLTDGDTYVVDSRATDIAGNVQTWYGNNNFLYAAGAPEAPVVTSSTHPDPGTWYNDAQPSFDWDEPYSPIGVVGYSILLDQYPGTIPDKIQDLTQRTYDAATTPDGTWYLHVRAVDSTNQWGPAGHVQVNIDTSTPQAPSDVTEESPDVDWHADGDVTVHWSAVPNTGSGLTYRLERQVTPFGGSPGSWTLVISTTETSHAHNPGGYGDGDAVLYRVRAANSVGLFGGWTESDGMTIDSQTPARPDWVYDGNPDVDYHSSANGALTVYWDTVPDTGSGITYRLEKRVNAAPWSLVAEGLTGNSQADFGSYSDGDVITYRVTAINGVGLESASRDSDNFTIDTELPSWPSWVREGINSDPDWDYDDDGTFSVYWSTVPDTGSGITYRLERSVDDGPWQLIAEDTGATNRADSGSYADGASIRYRVTPINGAGSEGPYRLSDGIVIDLDAPVSPLWIHENSPDVDYDTDGAVWVNWASVPNTGSGITYELQKQIDGGGWTTVNPALAVTNYDDTATYGDDVLIEYQVIAHNSVGRSSAPSPSDGVRVDTGTPGTPSGVGEGDLVNTDDDYDQDNAFFVFWTGVSPTATDDQVYYTVERNVNGSTWNTAISGWTDTFWEDPQAYSNGDQVAYRITAVNGAGTVGAASIASDGILIDTGRPNSDIQTAGYYNAVSWPDQIAGTASDDYSEVALVEITIYDTDDNLWWNGTAWAGGGPYWLTASDTDNWTYALGDGNLTDGHAYDLQSRATDNAGNVETSLGSSNFIFADSGPEAPVISSTSHPVQADWYNVDDPDFDWTIPGGPAPIVGYSYVLDQNTGTTPDTIYDTTGLSASYVGISDGTWFFHVRALDSAGNWGPAGHYQINIDTATPNAPGSVIEDNPDVDDDYDGAVTVEWPAVPDTGSGIEYELEICVNGGLGVGVPCGSSWVAVDSNLVGTLYPHAPGGYTDGNQVRYRVRATNGVGTPGLWTTSDGMTIDSQTPATPASVTENVAAPGDEDYDADGSVRAYWESVADTGSGLTYRLERRVTVSGVPGPWILVSDNPGGTSHLDPQVHSDGALVEYRVRAENGVGSFSDWQYSEDGILIDTETPAAPTQVTEDSPDVDWSVDGNVDVFWNGVPGTGSPITYRLEKQINGGAWNLVADDLPAAATSLADSGSYNDGDTVRYRVRASNGAGHVGEWRESDGMTIDSNPVPSPGWVREDSLTDPDSDYYDANGPMMVYWAAVGDTGSGITYNLERCVDGGLTGACTSTWASVTTGLAGTSHDDGQVWPDGTTVYYRVTAVNGVDTAGIPAVSDGITVDTGIPAIPTGLGEGDVAGTDDVYDNDNTFYVFWTAPADTGSGLSYDLEKSLNSGGWVTAISGVSGTSWEDFVPYSNGDNVRYRVRAVSGAGLPGAWSGPSSSITLDFVAPDSAVSTSGYYNAFSWPGFIYGTSSDSGSDVAGVDITIQRASDSQYWDGATWQGSIAWLAATGAINWQYTFTPTDGETYDVRSRATDNADNVEITFGTSSFTYSSSGPEAPEISSSTHSNEAIWYDNSNPTFEWTVPSSAAPVVGYSYILDQNPGTTPDAVADTTALIVSYSGLADGTWYFHVRALDDADNWGPADHFAVHIDTATPVAPGWITEESPDIDFDADGSFTIYWDDVTDTGSGITYRLERNSGAGWTLVGTTTATNLPDSGSYAAGTFILYRVRAENGVGYTGGWITSDGVTIDDQTPDAPDWVREGVDTDPDWDWDADGAYTVYWDAVDNTGSGIEYQLYRRVNSGAWQLLITTDETSYADSGTYADHTLIEYQVVAVNGADTPGDFMPSDGIRIDSDVPATPAAVTEGDPDVDWDYDGNFVVYWSGVAETGSGITYRLERNLNGAGWAELTSTGLTNYADSVGNTDGTFAQYRVTAINGVDTEGTPRVSDGVTVDSQAVPQPGWVREDSATEPDRDYHPNADGAITIYWDDATDTGSGITYRLEKRVNSVDPWTLVASGLLNTSHPDSGAYADDDFIEYRVTAVNGVATESAPRLSDGMTIDTDTPDAPTGVGEGDVAGTDDDFDQDNVFYVFWTAPSGTGSDLNYTVERSRNGGAWEQAATGLSCATPPCQWDDPVPYSNGDTVQYRVTVVNGAGHQSAPSLTSDGITLDFAEPDSSVTTHGYYNAFNWPGMVQGTAADSISDVDFVDIYIRDTTTGLYWNGTAWQADGYILRATGTLNWQYPLASANLTEGNTYDVRSRATDRAENIESTLGTNSFTYASEGPEAPVVSSGSHPVQANWYNNDDPAFVWTIPSSVAPIVGYSFILDQNPGTTPDAVADSTGTSVSYIDVADGTWWFHVRAFDDADNWGPAGHYRINVDTTTPDAPALVTEETPDVDLDADGSYIVYWDGVNDTGSGITYEIQRNLNGAGFAPLASGIAATQLAEDIGAVDGATASYRVRAVNGVGLTSSWATSDGLTVDSDVPGDPGPVTEGDPTPDITHDADGSFSVYWNGVTDTGSGITYRLERQINSAGYSLVAEGLSVTNQSVSGSYADGDVVQYRVTAVNGVGTAGPGAESSGVIIDSETPAAPAAVTEESPDVDWDVDGNVTVYWSGVADTGSGITYRLERRVNSASWGLVPGAGALAVTERLVTGAYNDNDLIEFRVRVTNGVGLTGPWTQSDGVRIDSSTPGTPGNVTENSPDVDYISDPNGALTVYWNSVSNTGSGITYRVERDLNNLGVWTLVGNTSGANMPDSDGPYADDDLIRYRVTAVNGVDTAGTPGLSDGVRIDLDTPSVPANVGEGDAVGTDDDYDEDNVFYVFWDAVAPTASGDTVTYVVERSRNGGAWEQATSTTATSWDDSVPYSNGDTVNYRVTAVSGAGTQSAASAPSDGLTLDFARPDSAVTTGGFYNAFDWPGFIYGTASDTLSGVDFVDITIRDAGTGDYWDGDSWEAAVTWLRATGDVNWQYTFAPQDSHTYDVQSRATDQASNVEITLGYSSFTYASSGPQAPVVSSSTHPDPGTWYNDDDPTFEWTEPPSGAGIQGYSYVLDQTPGTTPNTILDTSTNSISYADRADGAWYLHVRAQDNSDNWGPAGHFVIHIDTTPPDAPSEVTEDAPDVDWDADGNIVVYWDPVTDLSGVTYTLERQINGGGWVQVDTNIAGASYADFSTNIDGDFVEYRVRATNGVAMSSAWTTSDGMTIDSIAPASPAPVTEDAPDIDWSADGAVTVYWNAVANTGSGITYRLERSVNSVWTTVAPALAGASYADSGSYADGDFIEYRVTAVSGVGLASPTETSDGMTIDSELPATPGSVTEETPDVDWDLDGNVTVYWSGVADTGSGITYRLERRVNSTGGWAEVTTQAGTNYADSGAYNDNDFIEYRVTTINGVGLEGTPGVSDGVTVDSSVPGTPGNVSEDDPDIDFYPNADGAVTVYWDAVTDTGSGVTYQLERRVNGGGWAGVVGNIASTFYPDSGAYADDDLIEYQVIAVNGVGTEGSAGQSDGLRIDLDVPAIPTNVGEGDVAGVDDDFDEDNGYLVFWDAAATTASGDQITYDVERSRNGAAWQLAGSALLCTTTPCQWEDPVPFSNGDTVQYRVIASNSAGHSSDPSVASSGITLDFAPPDSAVTTNGYYNSFDWPGFIYGTASDGLSDVDFVDISVQRQSDDQYWNGTGWQGAEYWIRTTGMLNWQYGFSPGDGETYTVHSRATDNAGNEEVTFGVSTFTYASSGPPAPDISSPTHPDEGAWYNDDDPTFDWTTPSSPAGIQGYSYILDHSPTTLPDSIIESNDNSIDYTNLDDGVWYFHVRAQDNADNWGAADHFRVNVDTSAPAAPDEITEETPDVDWDADGNVTIYWSDVVDGGSDITYRLERNLNGGGWELVAADLADTEYADTGYANGDAVVYRVQAGDEVGLSSGWTESDGVAFDLTIPPAPANVGEGDVVGTDDDWDQDNVFFAFWDAVPATPSGITYSVERSRNGGAWEAMVTGLATTQWEDYTPYSGGESAAYRVTAHTGAGLSSPASAPSDGLMLDFVRPDSTIETSGFYNNFTWPGHIEGTASDDLSDVAFVDITLQRQSDSLYWDGDSWETGPMWLRVTNTSNWQYAFAPADGETYDVQSRATDNADNVETSPGNSTFNYSASGPGAPEISSSTHPDEDTWYNNDAPAFEWSTPPSGSGISGYSYVLDQLSDTEPDLSADTPGNSRSYINVIDGVWYFHVRALDNAGNWGPPDHFQVNIDTTNPPAPEEITEEDPDIDWDADGDVTVYWSVVSDISDVTYILERSTNGGGAWDSVTTGITGTSALDPVTHVDGVTILYRVRAEDSVGLLSPWTQSDGVTIDSQAPDGITGLGEGDVVGTDDVWDEDNTFYVFWDEVANTGAGIHYTIERSVNGGAWEVVQSDYLQTFWEDLLVFDDGEIIRYRVTAINGVGTAGPVSPDSSGITMDFTRPDSAIVTAGNFGPMSWPGYIEGTASDDNSGVDQVDITLQRASDGLYWNGGAWVPNQVWLAAADTATWAYSFAPEDGENYNVLSRATDAAGNREVSYGASTFSYTISEPDSAVDTSGLYVGTGWLGQIEGTAYAPMADVDFVDVTIQRVSDGLYFDGAAWDSAAVWLRATGTNPWTFLFTPDDGETYIVESRATDETSNVEMVYGSSTFSYDAAAPKVETVDVASDSAYFYNPGLDTDGGTVYFNSGPGEGAGQTLTVTLTFSEPHPAHMVAATAFGDTPPLDTAAPWTVEYSVEAYVGTQPDVLFTLADTLGLEDTAAVDFVQDNLPPESDASIADDATNTPPIVIDWEANDSSSGVHETRLWVKYQPIGDWTDTGLSSAGVSGNFAYTPTSGSGTYYFATVSVDNVSNVQSEPTGEGDDAIDYDNIAPESWMSAPTYATTSPITIDWTASNDAKYVYLYYRYGEAGDWKDVTFSQDEEGTFEFETNDGDGHYYLATVAIDGAGNGEDIAPDGKSMIIYDTTPPTSLASSPSEWNSFGFDVTWSGDDTAVGSRIALFDVQVKVEDDGEWTDLITQTVETSTTYTATYVSEPDAVYHFRSRATDNAGHVEGWPEEPNGDTTTIVHFPGSFPGKYKLYMPLILQAGEHVLEPDIELVIMNCGDTDAIGTFLVDLYIDPDNSSQYWPISYGEGHHWFGQGAGFEVKAIGAGQSLTLYLGDAVVQAWPDSLPVSPTLYAQVDWWQIDGNLGVVDEGTDGEKNNVAGSSGNVCNATPGKPDLIVVSITRVLRWVNVSNEDASRGVDEAQFEGIKPPPLRPLP